MNALTGMILRLWWSAAVKDATKKGLAYILAVPFPSGSVTIGSGQMVLEWDANKASEKLWKKYTKTNLASRLQALKDTYWTEVLGIEGKGGTPVEEIEPLEKHMKEAEEAAEEEYWKLVKADELNPDEIDLDAYIEEHKRVDKTFATKRGNQFHLQYTYYEIIKLVVPEPNLRVFVYPKDHHLAHPQGLSPFLIYDEKHLVGAVANMLKL